MRDLGAHRLYLVREILSILDSEGFDLAKETHPGKSFLRHVMECAELGAELVERIYGTDARSEELKRFVLVLCALHDVGKLSRRWSLSQARKLRHSPQSARWILERGRGRWLSSYYDALLPYFIFSHHAPLRTLGELLRRLPLNYVRTIREVLRTLSKEAKVRLVDAFGIFKLADVASAADVQASYVTSQYEWPNNLDATIESDFVRERALDRRGSVDKRKLSLQKQIASSTHKHLVVAAPTGWGKTALAMLRAAHLKPSKVFYVLPTITAIKDLYGGLREALPEGCVGEHFYFADVELAAKELSEDYTFDIYRYFVPKFTITTIDQLLLTTLQAGRYYLRRFNLNRSLLVLDEYHLLTPGMVGALKLFLKSLARFYKLSCLFMTATPSPIYQGELLETLDDLKDFRLESEYRNLKRHKIELAHQKVKDFVSDRSDILDDGRVLVIVNTVKGAQELYLELKDRVGDDKRVSLIHSEFAYRDRSKREREIDCADILVSTQVAEVSLDISFNYLITERAPLPSLIQRFGRVNRYGGQPSGTNVYICEPETDQPYGLLLMRHSEEKLLELLARVEREGEAAYLDDGFWDFEREYDSVIEKAENTFAEALESLSDFFSITTREKVLKALGREETWLALPELYAERVRKLRMELSKTRDYSRRRRIYAKIKEYFVPVPWSTVKNCRRDDELELFVVKEYRDDLGVVKFDEA